MAIDPAETAGVIETHLATVGTKQRAEGEKRYLRSDLTKQQREELLQCL